MKVVQINATYGIGSTGKICAGISRMLTAEGIENQVLYCGKKVDFPNGERYGGTAYIKLQALRSRISGHYGFHSKAVTRKLLRKLDSIRPDLVHIHNIHSHNCNLRMLFAYLKKHEIKVCWTFHDCWAFTGYCPNFDMVDCQKWKGACGKCPQRGSFSWFFDKSGWLQGQKKALFTSFPMTVVTPSQWMADIVKESFLKEQDVRVIPNGINLAVFRPRESAFRSRYGCADRWIVLGVAFGWDKRKGLDVFLELSRRLDHSFQIVLVGTDERTDKQLPPQILSIHRTCNQQELAEIYSAADVLVNPTREDNYPTVNMEALACAVPLVTFDTGGSPEIPDESCGTVVEKEDMDALTAEVIRICENRPFSKDACLARAKNFEQQKRYREYLALYKELLR